MANPILDEMTEVPVDGTFKLWIDDDAASLKNQYDWLVDEGCQVVVEPDIQKAIDLLNEHHNRIRGVIVDLMIAPKALYKDKDTKGATITGYFIVEEIINFQENQNIPIVILTNNKENTEIRTKIIDDFGINVLYKSDYLGKSIINILQEI